MSTLYTTQCSTFFFWLIAKSKYAQKKGNAFFLQPLHGALVHEEPSSLEELASSLEESDRSSDVSSGGLAPFLVKLCRQPGHFFGVGRQLMWATVTQFAQRC